MRAMQSAGITAALCVACAATDATEDSTAGGRGLATRPRVSTRDTLSDDPSQPEAGWAPLSERVILIADNQQHDVLGSVAGIYKTLLADELTQVAIRPPELDLFSEDLLRAVIGREQEGVARPFFVHLGDACNVSTTSEFARFAWTMRSIQCGWVMAPGNHDGYFFGIESRVDPAEIEVWKRAAAPGGREMQRDRFVAYYLAALLLQENETSFELVQKLDSIDPGARIRSAWNEASEQGVPRPGAPGVADRFDYFRVALDRLAEVIHAQARQGSVRLTKGAGPRLRRIGWRIDPDRPWASFVVQELDLAIPAATQQLSLVLLDTSDYSESEHEPSKKQAKKKKGPSAEAAVGERQAGLVGSWIRSSAPERRWLYAGHHPLAAFKRETSWKVPFFLGRGPDEIIPLYLSAHTHRANFTTTQGRCEWADLTVGSTADTPIEYSGLQIFQADEDPDLFAAKLTRVDLANELLAHVPPATFDGYTRYEAPLLQALSDRAALVKIRQQVLQALGRLIRNNPPLDPQGRIVVDDQEYDDASMLQAIDSCEVTTENVLDPDLTRLLVAAHRYSQRRVVASPEQVRWYRVGEALRASLAEQGDDVPATDVPACVVFWTGEWRAD